MCVLARNLDFPILCTGKLWKFDRKMSILKQMVEIYIYIFELFRFNRYVRLGAFRHAYRICVTGLKSMILNPRPSKVIF